MTGHWLCLMIKELGTFCGKLTSWFFPIYFLTPIKISTSLYCWWGVRSLTIEKIDTFFECIRFNIPSLLGKFNSENYFCSPSSLKIYSSFSKMYLLYRFNNFSLVKLIQICYKLFFSKFSNPKMSRILIVWERWFWLDYGWSFSFIFSRIKLKVLLYNYLLSESIFALQDCMLYGVNKYSFRNFLLSYIKNF